MNSIARTSCVALAVQMFGCATAGQAYAGSPVAFEGASAAPGRRAADALALAGPVLERAAFVRLVLDRNPSIESARQAWRAASARVRQSGVLGDPMVTVGVAPLTIGSHRTRLSWDATLSQKLPWPGKLSLDQAVASAEADAARSDFEAARRDLALTAALLFDEYFVVARSIEVNAHHVDRVRRLQAAAAAQLETGRGGAQDSLQAELELAHMEHDAMVLAAQRDITVAEMNELLQRAPREPLPPPPPALPVPPTQDALDAARLEREAAQHRPDILAARTRARGEQLRADRAARESFPDVAVQAAYDTMWEVPEQRWTVGLSFDLPVQLGRRAGAVDEANAMRARFEADAARLTDAARTQVAVALTQLEESTHVFHLYEQRLVPVARDEVEAARAAFTASRAPFATLLEAEESLRSVELEMQTASADVDRWRAELDHALGRVPGLDGKGAVP